MANGLSNTLTAWLWKAAFALRPDRRLEIEEMIREGENEMAIARDIVARGRSNPHHAGCMERLERNIQIWKKRLGVIR